SRCWLKAGSSLPTISRSRSICARTSPITRDVKWNLLRVRRPDPASGQYASQSNWFSGIDTPDKYTIILTSDSPRPAIFDLFENLNMLDQATIDMEAGPKQTKAVGTGPFIFKDWVQGDHLSF